MRPVGIGGLPWNDGVEAIGESVLHGRSNADVRLHPGDDHALDALFTQEERKVGGEKRAVPALRADNFARAFRLESFEEFGVLVADKMMARQLAPFVVIESRVMLLDRVDDNSCRRSAPEREARAAAPTLRRRPDRNSAYPARKNELVTSTRTSAVFG